MFLHHPHKGYLFILSTDSSLTPLGAALFQKTDEGKLLLISCASRSLKGAELNYFTTELELLAIVWAVLKFRTFLMDSRVQIQTDHEALTFLMTCRFLSGRLTRWILCTQDYDLEVIHIPGKVNVIADALSRPFPCQACLCDAEALIAIVLARRPDKDLRKSLSNLGEERKKDIKLEKKIQSCLKEGNYRDYFM